MDHAEVTLTASNFSFNDSDDVTLFDEDMMIDEEAGDKQQNAEEEWNGRSGQDGESGESPMPSLKISAKRTTWSVKCRSKPF